MNTYWKDETTGELHKSAEETYATANRWTRINRIEYRRLRRERKNHELAMQESDNDGRPFKDAGR